MRRLIRIECLLSQTNLEPATVSKAFGGDAQQMVIIELTVQFLPVFVGDLLAADRHVFRSEHANKKLLQFKSNTFQIKRSKVYNYSRKWYIFECTKTERNSLNFAFNFAAGFVE